MKIEPIPATDAPSDQDQQLDELQIQLEQAEQANRLLKRKLALAQGQAHQLQMQQEQILSSRSWRLTAPLRGFRTLLGAPPPLDVVEAIHVPPDAEEIVRPEWDSLIPQELPVDVLAASPDEALRTNEVCEILKPDRLLEGMLPDALIGQIEPRDVQGQVSDALYFGTDINPPKIAFLGSRELATELAFDASVTALTEEDWDTQLASADFDLMLLEPVWHVGNQQWRSAMSASGRDRPAVEAMLSKAKDLGTPRVLWYRASTADLAHFGWLAGHVDAAYATDAAAAQALGEHAEVITGVLAPAIQPAMHNPMRTWEQLPATGFADQVLFDGWLDLMEGGSQDPLVTRFKPDRLLVAESEWQFGGVRLSDCPDFKRNALGCLGIAGKLAVTKMIGAELFRKTPLVPDWRRHTMILRSIACGAVTADSSGSAERDPTWGGLPLRGDADEVGNRLEQLLADPLAKARLRHGAFREVFSHHCLADRLNQIADDLDLQIRFGRKPAKVACLLVTMRPNLLAGCLERFRADRYPEKELVVVLHGHDASLDEARALIRPGEPISIFQMGKELSLGSCLNFAAAQSDAEYWAKFDDDDLYGPNYLSDIMLYRRGIDFPIGGKSAAFTYLQSGDEIRWDAKYASQRSWQLRRAGRGERIHVAGGTLIGKREVLEEVPFSHVRRRGSDTEFLRRADASGIGFAAFDFFNFALFRSGTEGFHTWNADTEEVRQRTIPVGTAEDVDKVVFL